MKKLLLLTALAASVFTLRTYAQSVDAPALPAPPTPPAPSLESAYRTEPVIDLPVTTVAFETETHDFREIHAGDKVIHKYKFTNTGSNPLKIYNVKPSCGCTTPDWTKDPIAPGDSGYILVQFDSAGKSGIQKKSVTVTMNTEPKTKVLNFQGEVIPAEGN